MKTKAMLLRFLALALLSACVIPIAHAQWGWKDKDGRRIFSDQPPPSEIPEKDVMRRPGNVRAPVTVEATAAANATPTSSTSVTTATAPRISGKDTELEKKKKEADAKQAAMKKLEADKLTAARTDNCERAKRAKSTFDSGQRLAMVNTQGQREIMSDEARSSESKRLQDVIASNCN